MDQNLPPPQQTPQSSQQAPARRKGWSPLAIVLGLSAAFFAIFLLVSGVLFMSRGGMDTGMHVEGGSFFGAEEGSVGVIELKGVISDSKKIIRKLKAFEKNDAIKAVVLRVNSPGGAVAPSQEIYEEVKHYKKPIIASMGSVAASGAFYVSCGTQKIFADPGTITGSIGVIMEFANLEKLYQWAKIQRYVIKTGQFKDMGAEYRPMTDAERQLLQGMVENVLLQFKQAVATGRKLSLDQVTAIADGRIFSGDQAKKAHLVDELGSLEDAVNAAAKMGGIKGKPHVLYAHEPRRRLLDLILNRNSDDDDDESGSTQIAPVNGLIGSLTQVLDGLAGRGQIRSDGIGLVSPGIYWLWTGH